MFRMMFLYAFVIFYGLIFPRTYGLDFTYHNQTELENFLLEINKTHSDLVKVYSIGQSLKDNNLWVAEISAANGSDLGVPNVKLIGNIHGDEPVGREILLHFIQYLLDGYKSNDSTVKWLLERTRIHILPCMNPDGFAISKVGNCKGNKGRFNGANIDINRSFPDLFRKNYIPEQLETHAIRKWMKRTPFVLSASLHGGALVANYPYENFSEDLASAPELPVSLTPDNDVFESLATVYAQNHHQMHKGEECNKQSFNGGITNGAAWYPLTGGMQDYNYAQFGCMEITLEISCCKYPEAKDLRDLWEDNRLALQEYVSQVHRGVRGIVYDHLGKPVPNAQLSILNRDKVFNTTTRGEYWRILWPGSYKVQVTAPKYPKQIFPFHVKSVAKTDRPVTTILNIKLKQKSPPSQPQPVAPAVPKSATDKPSTTTPQDLKEDPQLGFVISKGCSDMNKFHWLFVCTFFFLQYFI